ncbi:AAA family ATPase [Aminirod propionatiphilus]|uniref:MoxR family ATPase n=1 Tax=Aminirod propionatiphilus TaxID=3415223 RepID=A0ACD1DWB4_9BACT|nr:MoxR family ATPase [Synergistota bacterium]
MTGKREEGRNAVALCHAALEAVGRLVVGKEAVLEAVLTALIADGHVLLEDVPGVAKTRIAKVFAAVLGLDFRRIQFVPDLLPGDVTGNMIFDGKTSSFSFRKGPIFASLILADEINRGTPKTQAALLEAMQERQITVDGDSFPLGSPFLVVATQNPIEFEGTYPLPEAQLDRFMIRLTVGYPSAESESTMLGHNGERRSEALLPEPVMTREAFLAIQDDAEALHVDPDIRDYIVRIARATREDSRIRLGVSPRGSLALFRLSRACALLRGRSYVLPDDVKAMATLALPHRLILAPELWSGRLSERDIVESLLEAVPLPPDRRGA